MNATSRYNLVTLKLDTSSLTVSARFSGGWSTVSRYFEARKRGGRRVRGGGRVSRETRERRTTFALSLCPSPGSQTLSTREGRRRGTRTRLTLFFFFLFFFLFSSYRGPLSFSRWPCNHSLLLSPGNLAPFHAAGPPRIASLPFRVDPRRGPAHYATQRARFVNVGDERVVKGALRTR